MINVEWRIEIQLQGPILTASSAPGAFAVDAVFARNHRDQLYLPSARDGPSASVASWG